MRGLGAGGDIIECLGMVTTRSAALMNLKDYGLEAGKAADFVVLDCESPQSPNWRRC